MGEKLVGTGGPAVLCAVTTWVAVGPADVEAAVTEAEAAAASHARVHMAVATTWSAYAAMVEGQFWWTQSGGEGGGKE